MWQYNHTDELYHHGVKGMKWGVRRASKGSGYVSAGKARKNARSASKDARLDSLRNDKAASKNGERITAYQAGKKMRKAGEKAYRDSINADREHNRQLRAEKKVSKAVKKLEKVTTKDLKEKHAKEVDTGYITVRKAMKNAKIASQNARRKVLQDAKNSGESKKLGSYAKVNRRANKAARDAAKKSINADREYNRSRGYLDVE